MVWLTQHHMADPFQTSKQTVGQYLKNILGELAEVSVVKNSFTTAPDGKITARISTVLTS